MTKVNKKVSTKKTATKVKTYKMTDYNSKSHMIRSLSGEGKSRSEIVKIISLAQGKPIRYQHVRNVLITPLMRDIKKEKTTKS